MASRPSSSGLHSGAARFFGAFYTWNRHTTPRAGLQQARSFMCCQHHARCTHDHPRLHRRLRESVRSYATESDTQLRTTETIRVSYRLVERLKQNGHKVLARIKEETGCNIFAEPLLEQKGQHKGCRIFLWGTPEERSTAHGLILNREKIEEFASDERQTGLDAATEGVKDDLNEEAVKDAREENAERKFLIRKTFINPHGTATDACLVPTEIISYIRGVDDENLVQIRKTSRADSIDVSNQEGDANKTQIRIRGQPPAVKRAKELIDKVVRVVTDALKVKDLHGESVSSTQIKDSDFQRTIDDLTAGNPEFETSLSLNSQPPGEDEIGSKMATERSAEKQRLLMKDFKNVMRTMPHPVSVITSSQKRERGKERDFDMIPHPRSSSLKERMRGMTVSSFGPVCLEPFPVVSFNVKKPSRTLSAIEDGETFCAHVLAADPHGAAIANAFTRYYEQPWQPFYDLANLPELTIAYSRRRRLVKIFSPGVVAVLSCRLLPEKRIDVGDHAILVAEIVHIDFPNRYEGFTDAVGLSYAQKQYLTSGAAIELGTSDTKPAVEREEKPANRTEGTRSTDNPSSTKEDVTVSDTANTDLSSSYRAETEPTDDASEDTNAVRRQEQSLEPSATGEDTATSDAANTDLSPSYRPDTTTMHEENDSGSTSEKNIMALMDRWEEADDADDSHPSTTSAGVSIHETGENKVERLKQQTTKRPRKASRGASSGQRREYSTDSRSFFPPAAADNTSSPNFASRNTDLADTETAAHVAPPVDPSVFQTPVSEFLSTNELSRIPYRLRLKKKELAAYSLTSEGMEKIRAAAATDQHEDPELIRLRTLLLELQNAMRDGQISKEEMARLMGLPVPERADEGYQGGQAWDEDDDDVAGVAV